MTASSENSESEDTNYGSRPGSRPPTRQISEGGSNTLVTGGTFNTAKSISYANHHHHYEQTGSKELEAIGILRANVTPGALHNSLERSDPPKCHRHTRKAVRGEIMTWVKKQGVVRRLLWLYGPAGSGKTSIAQSIAERCKKNGLLAADFFMSGPVPGRNDTIHLIATLAYQLTLSIPELRRHIASAVDRDPLIFHSSLEAQLDALVVQPFFQSGLDASTIKPRLIIIDGLDECRDPKSQGNIVSVISSAVQQPLFPFLFLIASRPQQVIRKAFNHNTTSMLTHRLVLDDTYKPDADIKAFLVARFRKIKNQHPSGRSLPSPWPKDDAIDFLVKKSSGQFIYASTIIKYIESPSTSPGHRLGVILGLEPRGDNTPFAELDAFYSHIFSSINNLDLVVKIFSFLIFKQDELYTRYSTMELLENFLGLRPGELNATLADLHSILDIPSPDDSSAFIRILHASLPDFLLDKGRSGTYYIDSESAHCFLFKCCIRMLSETAHVHEILESDPYFRYAVENLPAHCMHAGLGKIHTELQTFDFSLWLMPLFNSRSEVTRRFQYARLSDLYQWLEQSGNRVYHHFVEQFDKWLVSRFERYPKSPVLFCFLTFFAIGGDSGLSTLARIVRRGNFRADDWEKFENVDEAELGLEEALSITNLYYPMFSSFLLNPSRAGSFHISATKFMSLAKILLVSLIDEKHPSPPVLSGSSEEKYGSNDIQTRFVQVVDERTFSALQAIISTIPLEQDFAQFLEAHPISMNYRFLQPTTLSQYNATVDYIKRYITQTYSSYDATLRPARKRGSELIPARTKFKKAVRKIVYALRFKIPEKARVDGNRPPGTNCEFKYARRLDYQDKC